MTQESTWKGMHPDMSVTSSKATLPTGPVSQKNDGGCRHCLMSSMESRHSTESDHVVIADQWLVLGKVGEGSFGEVFEVEDMITRRHFAIKREPAKWRRQQLKHEADMYDAVIGGPGIPQCHWYGRHETYNCIVIDLLGSSLKEVREGVCDFPLDVVVDLGCQLIETMQHIHNRSVIFRDIKPHNFLFPASCRVPDAELVEVKEGGEVTHYQYSRPTCHELFTRWGEPHPKLSVVDFGLATWWRDPNTKEVYPSGKRNHRKHIGTARYASLNAHRGKQLSRRDDLEGVVYMLIDLFLGELPWSGVQARNSQAGWDKIRSMKEETTVKELCAECPEGFLQCVTYTRNLSFTQDPDYNYLKTLLRESLPGGKHSKRVPPPTDSEGNPQPRRRRKPSLSNPHHTIEKQKAQHDTIFTMRDLGNQLANMDDNRPSNPDDSSSGTSLKKLLRKMNEKKKQVGWNTHKYEEEEWIPEANWSKAKDQPSEASWGEDKPGTEWVTQANGEPWDTAQAPCPGSTQQNFDTWLTKNTTTTPPNKERHNRRPYADDDKQHATEKADGWSVVNGPAKSSRRHPKNNKKEPAKDSPWLEYAEAARNEWIQSKGDGWQAVDNPRRVTNKGDGVKHKEKTRGTGKHKK